MYENVLKFLKYEYDVKNLEIREEYHKFLVTELNKKRNNQVYDGKSIVEKYNEAVKNKEVFSKKPFWKLTNKNELDELLKLRQEINMIADGNCTVYAVISQLYPQTFGEYVLCPSPSGFTTNYLRVSKAREKVREIRQIANSSITNNEDASAFGDKTESVGEMAKGTWMSIEHPPGITAHYNRVIVVINPGVTSHMTKVFLPLQKCDFTVSLSLFNRDMSSYHMLLKDKFTDPNDVNVDVFVQLANELLHAELTGDSTLMEVIRNALECSDTIAYITELGHSRSLQMKNRTGLKFYVPPSLEVSDNSISVLGKEIPAVINDNELDITEEKENENSAKVERIIKYLKVMRQLELNYNEDDKIKDKDYREVMIMNVDGENYMKRYKDNKDVDEEQILMLMLLSTPSLL
jgi:hypothetical protein